MITVKPAGLWLAIHDGHLQLRVMYMCSFLSFDCVRLDLYQWVVKNQIRKPADFHRISFAGSRAYLLWQQQQ